MADTDTKQFVTRIDLANTEVTLVPAFQLLLYLAYNKRDAELAQFQKFLETVRAEKGVARVEWSPNDEVFREALIQFEADNHAILEAEKIQVERIVPRDAAISAENEFRSIHQEKLQKYRGFAKRLTDSYIDQLIKQTRNEDQKRALENYRLSLTKRVEGVLPNLVTEARSPNELVPRLSQYLAGIPAFEASLQELSENAGPAAQVAASEAAPQAGELFLDPTVVVEQSVYAPVLDKSAFVRIYRTLSSENPTYSPQQIAGEATKLSLLNQALNGVIEPELDTDRSDVFLTAFAKTGLQRFVAPIAAALPDKTKAVLSEIILRRSWEKAVDDLTRNAGGRIAIELTPLIQQGNRTMGSGPQRGVSSLQNVIGDTASFIFGSPTAEMTTFLKLAHVNTTGAGREKGQSQAQVAMTESRFLLLTSLLFVHAPERFRVYYQHGTETAGHGLRFIFDLGSDVIFGKILKSGAVQAGATAVKKGATSFIAGFLTKLGLSATADVVLAIVGTPIATAIKWAVQAAIWLGGYLWRPLASLVGRFFRGEIGPLAGATGAIKETVRSILGGVSAAQPRARWDDDLPKLLAWGAVIAVLLFMLPLSPFSNFTDMVRSAALITSLAGGGNEPTNLGPALPNGSGVWPTTGCINQGPFGGPSHGRANAIDFGAKTGDPVYAVLGGVVNISMGIPDGRNCESEDDCKTKGVPLYGNLITIAGHDAKGNPYTTYYGHLQNVLPDDITDGMTIEPGKHIGYADTTGHSTGSHLHFEYSGGTRLNEQNTVLPIVVPTCANKEECAKLMGANACVSATR